MSKISDAISKVTGNSNSESDVAYDKIEAAKAASVKLVKTIESRNAALLELEKSLSNLSVAAAKDESKMPAALKAQETVEKLMREIAVLRRGLAGAGEAITAAEREFDAAGFGKRVAEVKRTCTLKLNSAQGIEAAAKDLAQHWRNYLSAAAKQVALTPSDIGGKGGVMTRVAEISDAMAKELRRHNPLEATTRADVVPIPGQDSSAFVSTKNLVPFVAATEAANAHIIELFEKSLAPAPVEKAAPAPLPPVPPVLSVTGEIIPDEQPGVNMAAMPLRKESLTITNTNAEE